ncbi:hypothetical protein AADZ90_002350 [Aestuariibius sp. 2305UL40-4]|uniref:hypothetical protein n=1 Tax=Aestuariibius violaceus TaxID=3234132 RepID=UPI00345EBF4E
MRRPLAARRVRIVRPVVTVAPAPRPAVRPAPLTASPEVSRRWVRSQVVNARRHLERLRPFKREWFGDGLARPREANIRAANALVARERAKQQRRIERLEAAAKTALADPRPARLMPFVTLKDRVASGTRQTEGIWYFYDAIFAQRKGVFANELAAMDRIALDCYQSCYMGLGRPRSLPTPPPMAFTEPASGPATYRRGVRVPKLARRANPFPLVRLPFHRMMNPWSLGAVPHEIGHNIHADLGLWSVTPRLLRDRLARLGMPGRVQATWARWHKEIYADLIGILLIGPAYVESLMDVVGKSPSRAVAFRDGAVHPTSYLRPFISTELLRRTGFAAQADALDDGWRRIYGPGIVRRLPADIHRTFAAANRAVVAELTQKPMRAYGGKSLVQVVRFRPEDLAIQREAAERLAQGTNPGIAPARFFIGAAREALDRKLAPPETIVRNFYTALTGK